MADCNTYCLTPMPEQVVNNCSETIAGGGKNAIVFDCNADAVQNSDYTTATINSDVANGFATIIRETIIEAPDASPNAAGAAAVAGEEPIIKNYTQTVTISDANVSTVNDTAYKALDATSGRKIAAILVTTVDEDSLLYEALSSFQMTVTKPLTGSTDDFIKYTATATGKMKHMPVQIATPANVY